MTTTRRRLPGTATPAAPTAPRASRARQRQRLIDACISALHVHGPSKTTVEKVVAIAQMSPGIVRFYFESKDAMLVASLEFLSGEFEERLLVPILALREQPVEALERLVDLYLGPELASARKVSVWYSFWGEASSRQEYFDICGTRDSKFESLVRELVEAMIQRERLVHLDADAIALGLIGVLEMLWQGFAFQTESTIDRASARRRAMAYLRSVFPAAFGRRIARGVATPLPASAYTSAALYAAELDLLFRESWQFLGLAAALATPGDYLAAEGPADSIVAVRDDAGTVRAFVNRCPQRPHPLAPAPRGRLAAGLSCALHGLHYDLAGTPRTDSPGSALPEVGLVTTGGLLWTCAAGSAPAPEARAIDAADATTLLAAAPHDVVVAADWKVLVEHWLERAATPLATGAEFDAPDGGASSFLAPNQWLTAGATGLQVLQVVPVAPGRSRLRLHAFARAGATADLADAHARVAAQAALAEAVQRGIESPGFVPEAPVAPSPALAEFRRSIARLLPGGTRHSGD